MENPINSFADFEVVRARLVESIRSIALAYGELRAVTKAKQLEKLAQQTADDTFRVLVVGEFKNSKSTLINALLSTKLLPEANVPCTAVVTHIRYGDRRRAVLHWKDGRPTTEIDLEVPGTTLAPYIRIQDFTSSADEDAETTATSYSFIEVYYPLELCRLGVEIIDSPGLNEHYLRTRETMTSLALADAVVCVLTCVKAMSGTEQAFLDTDLRDRNLKDVFFPWNHFDMVRDNPSDVADLQRLSRQRLESIGAQPDRIFWLSGKEALEGKLSKDGNAVSQSGILEFEQSLQHFLTFDRGRVKLSRPLNVASEAIRDGLGDLLIQRDRMYRLPLEELQDRVMQAQPKLYAAEQNRREILSALERRAAAMTREVRQSLQIAVNTLYAELPRRAELEPATTWQAIASRSGLTKRLGEVLDRWLRDELERWQERELLPLLTSHFLELQVDLNQRIETFLGELSDIKATMGTELVETHSSSMTDVSPLQRLAGASIGWLGGPGSMLEGATLGPAHMARGLALHVLASVGLVMGGFGAVVIIPALAVIGVVRTAFGAKSVIAEVRGKVVAEVQASLTASTPQLEREITAKLDEKIAAFRSVLEERLSASVNDFRRQLDDILEERLAKHDEIEIQLARLAEIRQVLMEQAAILDEIWEKLEPRSQSGELVQNLRKGFREDLADALKQARSTEGKGRETHSAKARIDSDLKKRLVELLEAAGAEGMTFVELHEQTRSSVPYTSPDTLRKRAEALGWMGEDFVVVGNGSNRCVKLRRYAH